jgi:glycosyltransferase involved in cell wall biosynthesis
MAYGLPVVAGSRDAAGELVEHGVSGLLVEPANLDELENALASLLGSPCLRREMGAQGRRIVQTRFAFERFRDELLRMIG